MTISGYTILNQMYESTDSLVYRAIREQDNTSVVMKVFKDDYPTQRQISGYTNEYNLLRSLHVAGVVTAYDLQKYKNGLAMILEDFEGELLRNSLADRRFTLDEFLRLAIQAAEVLEGQPAYISPEQTGRMNRPWIIARTSTRWALSSMNY